MKLLLSGLFAVLLLAPGGWGQSSWASLVEEDKDGSAPAETDKKPKAAEKEEDEKDEEEEEEDEYLAVVGGDLYTVSDGVLRGATLLAKNGKIHRIGYDITLPEEAATLDATGLRVYPGLVACNSSGIVGREPAEHTTDVFSLTLAIALANGLTTVVTGNSAAKLTYGTLEGIDLKKNLFVSLRTGSGADRRKLRQDLDKIRAYHRQKADYEQRKAAGEEDLEEPKPKGLNDGYRRLLEGQAVARFSAHDSTELRNIARLASEFGFKGVVFGGREAWVVADELGRAGLACVVTPRTARSMDRRTNHPNGPRIENAAMLHQSGVPVAVIPGRAGISLNGLAGRDLMTLPMEAAYAVRGGLSRQAALESITLGAARILGVGHRVGSLSEGKDCDFIVTDGDVLHYKTLVHYTVVNGKLAYDKSEESLFSHIRPLEGENRFSLPPEVLEELEEAHGGEEEATEGEEGEGEESGEGEDEPEGETPPEEEPEEESEEEEEGDGED
jgi:imidazolonepropionase-like amidohydrolase